MTKEPMVFISPIQSLPSGSIGSIACNNEWCDKRSFSSHQYETNDSFRQETQSETISLSLRKPHKINYLNSFDKKRVVSQYAVKYVHLLSLSPLYNGLQIPVGHFLYNFVAPLSHRKISTVFARFSARGSCATIFL